MKAMDQLIQSPEFVVEILVYATGAGWVMTYFEMIRLSFRDKTYSMPLISLCLNFSWEVLHAFAHPHAPFYEKAVFFSWALTNCPVMYAAIKFSPREWGHSAIVCRNLPWLFLAGFVAGFTGQLAIMRDLGAATTRDLGAAICQLVLSIGCTCQLLTRASTRGSSFLLWLSRTLASLLTVPAYMIQHRLTPDTLSWVDTAFFRWWAMAFVLADLFYGVCFWRLRQMERRLEQTMGNSPGPKTCGS